MKKILVLRPIFKKNQFLNKKVIFSNYRNYLKSKNYLNEKNLENPNFHIDQKLIEKNILKVKKYYKCMLNNIKNELNAFHGVKFNLRYWEILLGPWLYSFITLYVYTHKVLNDILVLNKPNEIEFFKYKNFNFCTQETAGFIYASGDYLWSGMFESLILEKIYNQKKIEKKFYKNTDKFIDKYRFKNFYFKNLRKIFFKKIFNLLKFLPPKNKALIDGTFLPKLTDIKLNLSFGQAPFMWSPASIKNLKFKKIEREKLNFKIRSKDYELEYLSSLTQIFIPKVFIEGFEEFRKKISSLGFATKPKFILTSSLYSDDESFKFYTAEAVYNGAKYFIAQHGNNYFTDNICENRPELSTCDYFISWGEKKKNNKKILPLFNFKTADKKIQYSENGKIVIFLRSMHNYQAHLQDEQFEIFNSYKSLINLINMLKPSTRKNIIIRLGSDQKNKKDEFIKNFFSNSSYLKNIKIDDYRYSKKEILKKSKLNVHFYDSTGYLEDLSLNFPSICFLPSDIKMITKSSRKDYKNMISNNLMFSDIKKLSKQLNYLDNKNIINWWINKKNKKKIINFSKLFCKQSNTDSHLKIKNLIQKNLI